MHVKPTLSWNNKKMTKKNGAFLTRRASSEEDALMCFRLMIYL